MVWPFDIFKRTPQQEIERLERKKVQLVTEFTHRRDSITHKIEETSRRLNEAKAKNPVNFSLVSKYTAELTSLQNDLEGLKAYENNHLAKERQHIDEQLELLHHSNQKAA